MFFSFVSLECSVIQYTQSYAVNKSAAVVLY